MHILHLINAYGGTAVHVNLIEKLDDLGIKQTIVAFLNPRNHDRIGKHQISFKVSGSRIVYSTAVKSYHKYLYKAKIFRCVKELKEVVNLDDINMVHASTLCSDGAIAYYIKKKYRIPYISAVRGTDISNNYKHQFWLKYFFNKVANNAAKLIFISPNLLRLYKLVNPKVDNTKCLNIPNGIDECFFDTTINDKKLNDQIKLVYVGAFTKNKGIIDSILAIESLRVEGFNISFEGIGKGLPFRVEEKRYLDDLNKLCEGKSWVKLYDFISKEELKEKLRENDIFIMPAVNETFGLVYVEAMSQGLPIIYTKGHGFDGYFPDGYVGYPVIAHDITDIASKIKLSIINFQKLRNTIIGEDLRANFTWVKIASKYEKIYKLNI